MLDSLYSRCRCDWLFLLALLALLESCGGPSAPSPLPTADPSPPYSVRGVVRDGGNLNLLIGATVQLAAGAGSRGVTTGFDGQFSFDGVIGEATLAAPRSGYEASTLVVNATVSMLDMRMWLWQPGEAPDSDHDDCQLTR